ncbi:FGGY-family carbohydrate kinase [Aestuariivirga sp.]|uniref:FGGY-family carbohydrate kinase n=1 Tax=Aestuariivirga sp. TaxID=2650926 RepID=UPI00301B0F53
MKDGVLIGIDAGTSVIKSIAFTTKGEQIASAAIPNRYQTLPDGGAEQDMARTWADTAATLKQLSEKVPNLKDRLIAISVTGQGDGMWLIDKAGEPVAPAWLWLDARAAAITEAFVASADYPAHYKRTGTGVNACQMSMQLAWMTRNRPDILARATTGFHCKDWLYFNLTGDRRTDPSEANFTFGQYATRTYAPDVLDVLGASDAKSLLPEIVEGTQAAGRLTPEAASLTGLKPGTPITLGYVDVLCTGLGGGLYDPKGETGCTIVGSTGMHMKIAPSAAHVKLNAELSGYTMCFPVPGMYAQIQSNMASTLNIDWLLDLGLDVLASQGVERTRADLLKGLDERIMKAEPARALFHPYISQAGERGPMMEPSARAMFTGLELGMGFADMMRAVFEGLCFASRDCYSAMGEIPREVRVTGGAARSHALRVILASVLKAPVRAVQREEAGAAGAAMMAAVQQKLYPDMDACVAEWVTPLLGASTEPDPSLARRYDGAFGIYKETREKMRPLWREMVANRAS